MSDSEGVQAKGAVMNRAKMLTQIGEEIEENLPSLGVWQRRGLAVLVVGLLSLGQAQLSKIAEGVPEEGSYNTVRQRVKRWVSHSGQWVVAVGEEWIRWVWRKYGGQRAVLLVDETKLGQRFGVMMVSLAYAGRAIPLWWRCYRANEAAFYPAQGQVLLIYGLLAHVLSALPESARPLVQMDRGLAHSSAMLRALQSLRVDYLVRVKATARFTSRRGCSQLLKHWVRPGQATRLQGSLFDRDHACPGTICLIWESGQAEAWCLFTNTRRAIGSYYALRWWQEESFRDLKSAGWHWPTSHLACPMRMERLILVMAIAYAFALSSGVHVWSQPPRLRAETATPDELPRLGLFRLGLRYLRRVFADVTPLPSLALAFPAPAFFRRI
jgi:DDE family transposase